jgi:RNA polymerase sigma-70 factor (ECF subfamily)
MKPPMNKKPLRRVIEMMPDHKLIKMALAGEPIAYDVLAQRYRSRVEAVAAQFLHSSDREDCIQEAFLKALINLPSLRDPDKFGSWVCVIARNYCLDTLKRSRAISSIDEELPGSQPPRQLKSPRPAPLTEVLRQEETMRLITSMELLSDKYRNILDMRYFQDHDYATIARKTKKPLGTVKSLIHRAHNRLRELMADGSIQEGGTVVN